MSEVLTKATELFTQYADIALGVIGIFALVATKTPNTVDNRIAQFLADLVNFLGANVGKAKNDPSV
jgi:hypothetical protein